MTAWIWLAVLAAVAGSVMTLAVRRLTPRQAGAVAVGGAAVGLAALRQFALAVPLAALAWSLWRSGAPGPAPSVGQRSEVRSDGLAMSLDHDTGAMDGEVLDGPFAGARLSELSQADLRTLARHFEDRGDEDSLALLLAYLDRIGADAAGDEAPPAEADGGMSEAQALRILGLEPGADVEEVRAAYRRLIRRAHPDLGGSSGLAAMINEAKARLDPD
jgi:hypothetical protein